MEALGGCEGSEAFGVCEIALEPDGREIWQVRAYRRAYAEAHGDPPEGFHIHHLCGNNSCVRPEHLVAVSVDDHRKFHKRESFCVIATAMNVVKQEQQKEKEGSVELGLADPFADMDEAIDEFLKEDLNG